MGLLYFNAVRMRALFSGVRLPFSLGDEQSGEEQSRHRSEDPTLPPTGT